MSLINGAFGIFKTITYNVSHIAEGGEYEAQNLNLKQMFNRSKTVYFSTKPPLLAICCYVPFLFTNIKQNGLQR